MKLIGHYAEEQLTTSYTEAEIREILEAAVRPSGRVKLGSPLAAVGRDAEASNNDVEALQQQRDRTPAVPMTFE